jgi:hypothetical protein
VAMAGASMEVEQDLPGFRFHPTEEELLDFYLDRMVHGKKLHFDIIGTLNIYRHDPWDLPGTYVHDHQDGMHMMVDAIDLICRLIGRGVLCSDGEDRGEGVVLLRAAGPEGRQRRAAESDDGARVLEGHGVGQGHPEQRRRQAGDRAQEDARLLPGARPAGHQDGLGHERVPPPRLRRRPRSTNTAASQGNNECSGQVLLHK